MQIMRFERSEFVSSGMAVGEGLAYSFVAMNDTGRIVEWHQKVDDQWLIVTGPAPFSLRTLVATRCADERWRHNEGPAVVDLRSEP